MTDPAADPPATLLWWHVAAVGVSLVSLGVVAATVHGSALVAWIAVAGFLVAWFAFGRRTLDGARGWQAFTAVIVAVGFAGTLAAPAFATWQTLAFPLVWTLAPGLRTALVANVALAAAVAAGYAVSTGSVLEAVVVELLSLGLSLVIGVWITRIAVLSEQRRALADRLRDAQQEAAALSRDAGIAAERERIAREVHDTIAQSLTGVVMLAERARRRHPDDEGLVVLEETARAALGETRGLVAATASVPLDGGLTTAVASLAARFQRETGVTVTHEVRADVPRGLEVVLLRCAQEGLANVRKHARAAHVDLTVQPEAGDVVLTVTDDGVGLPDAPEAHGFGLAGMRDRVALVGGTLDLGAGAGGGTRLVVRIPMQQPAVTP